MRVGTKTAAYTRSSGRGTSKLARTPSDWSWAHGPFTPELDGLPFTHEGGTRINPSFASGQRLRHEVYIDTGNRERNRRSSLIFTAREWRLSRRMVEDSKWEETSMHGQAALLSIGPMRLS